MRTRRGAFTAASALACLNLVPTGVAVCIAQLQIAIAAHLQILRAGNPKANLQGASSWQPVRGPSRMNLAQGIAQCTPAWMAEHFCLSCPPLRRHAFGGRASLHELGPPRPRRSMRVPL